MIKPDYALEADLSDSLQAITIGLDATSLRQFRYQFYKEHPSSVPTKSTNFNNSQALSKINNLEDKRHSDK